MKSYDLNLESIMKYYLITVVLFLLSVNGYTQNITAFEYFIDTDPGVGLATPANPTASPTVTDFNIPISISSLSAGFHTLYIRGKNTAGDWTHTHFKNFYIVPFTAFLPTDITQIEYFVDTDPGIGLAIQVAGVTPSALITNLPIDIAASAYTPGFHTLYVRTKNSSDEWTHTHFRNFYVVNTAATADNLVKFEYFFDTDPGFDNGTAAPIAPPVPSVTNQDIFGVLSSLSVGSHTIYVRAKDSKGFWSSGVAAPFTIVPCNPPTGPTAVEVSRCDFGSVTLNAAGASGEQVYRWYADASVGTILFIGASFITPVLSATTTYYISIFDPATCESIRIPVTATISGDCPQPPAISLQSTNITIGGTTTPINLLPFITTFNSAVVVSSITVETQPPSGAKANVVDGVLTVDYTGILFVGRESITIRACDTNGSCSTQLFEIDVIGDVVIYNAISPNGDGKNDFLFLEYIDILPETQSNKVIIYNRWGDEVFSVNDYNNRDKVFKGESNNGNKLPTGIYFYKLAFSRNVLTGYLQLK
jgi:gliding motility-associated-like protein